MIEMNPDYAVRFYNIIKSDKKHPTIFSMEPSLFSQVFTGLDSARVLRDKNQQELLVMFDKEEALTSLSKRYKIHNIKELSCQLPSKT